MAILPPRPDGGNNNDPSSAASFSGASGERKLPGPTNIGSLGAHPGPVSDSEATAWAQKWYPGSRLAELVIADASVRAAVKQAVTWGWGAKEVNAGRFDAMFQQTNYWKTSTQAAGTPPAGPGPGGGGSRGGGGGGGGASLEQNIAAAEAEIRNQAGTLGRKLNQDQVHSIAITVVSQNWSAAQLNDYLTGGVQQGGIDALDPGTIKANVDRIRKFASDQLLSISDTTALDYATRIASGEMDESAILSLFQEQAKKEFTWATSIIDKGIGMRAYLAPSRDAIAGELEMPAEEVDLMDPKWMKMVTITDDKGQTRGATSTELQRAARADDRFRNTTRARQMADSAGMFIRQMYEGN